MPPDELVPRADEGLRLRLRGVTQGVGMRPFVHRVARACGVTGSVRNDASGVTVEAFGDREALDAFAERLRRPGLAGALVESVESEPLSGPAPARFEIRPSTAEASGGIGLAPDLATCPACLAEMRDPADRRHRHPFVSCTHCGPRLSVARALPYDRARTSMAVFPACEACAREYADPDDRRHHAETNACPDCGPSLWLAGPEGASVRRGDAALHAGARLLRAGAILALRGVGGYHLACDATDPAAVERLRKRKRRPRKPFAVMPRDLGSAREFAFVDAAEAGLLEGVEAPIVLLRARPEGPLSPGVAPGLPWLGVLLPYTPVHHLLLEAVGRPLVMTSGNLSGAPIVTSVEDAERDLAGVADAFLHHDREIEAPCDDSVVRRIAGRSSWLRRSRGCVPRPLALARPVGQAVLAVGAQHQNTLCLARGGSAWWSPHLGDLDSPEAVAAAGRAAERLETWLGVRPSVVAHDLNPRYESTRWAMRRDCELRLPVQHHHAHAVSAMAEHGLPDPALAFVFDGTGLGPDGTAWGGELLRVRRDRFERLATLRPIALAGGEVAIREVWRLALAALEDAFDGEPPLDALPLFRQLDPDRIHGVRRLIRRNVRCVPAHGAGRWFDAFAALGLDLATSAHSGDAAMAWNGVADLREGRAYPFDVRRGCCGADPALREIDLRPAVRAAVADRGVERPAAEIAGRFHATLAGAAAAVLAELGSEVSGLPVVLSGGCFQNALLAERVAAEVGRRFDVYLHEHVPCGDGGVALGQAIVADAVARRGTAPAGA